MRRFVIKSADRPSFVQFDFSLLDLIPQDELQKMQDNLAGVGNVASVITDPDGSPLTMPSNDLPVCRLIQSSTVGERICLQQLASICETVRQKLSTTTASCQGCGVMKAAVPIIVNDLHLANWWISQCCDDLMDPEEIESLARQAGLDGAALFSVVADTPCLSRADFDVVLSWIDHFVGQITQLGYQKFKLSRDLSKLSHMESELDKYKTKLEALVQERTAELSSTNKRLQLEVLERETAEEQIRRKTRLLDAINQVLHQIVGNRSEQALAKTCLRAAQSLTQSPFGFIVENQKGHWRVVCHKDQAVDTPAGERRKSPKPFEVDGLWKKMVQTGKPFIVQPSVDTALWRPLPKDFPEIKTLMAVPLPSRTGVSGFIALANNKRGYTAVDQTDVASLAHTFTEALLCKRSEQAKDLSERRLTLALDSAEEGLWDYFPQEDSIYYSPRWFSMLGYTEGELPNSVETWTTLAHPEDLALMMGTFEKIATGVKDAFRKELRMLSQQGQWRWVEVRGRTVERDEKGRVVRIVGTMVDISRYKKVALALQKANEELQRLAALDDLTQIANRRRFEERLADEWRRARRNSTPLGIIICDIDFFKFYNDTYGHLKGDEILFAVAQTISNTLKRPMDLLARYGGEEFAMILPSTDLKGAHRVAREVQVAVSAMRIRHNASIISDYVTLSFGVASMVAEGNTPARALLANADRALYEAKARGRNQIVLADAYIQPN